MPEIDGMLNDDQVSEAFVNVARLAVSLGVRNIHELPGCWEHQIDEKWWVALNGHGVPMKASDGAEVPPVECYVKYNGWPAGLFGPRGGVIAAGEEANERTFIEAIDRIREMPKAEVSDAD